MATKAASPLSIVACLLVTSEFVYLELARFSAVSTAESVTGFLSLMGALFLLYGTAYVALRRSASKGRSALVLISAGAVVFRLTLLFAGVAQHRTCAEISSAIRADVRGDALTYDSFLLFDNDIWRYLWDGHVGAAGVNPYLYAPGNPALNSLADPSAESVWSDIRANVNHPDIPTIYPPLAQITFRLGNALAPGSVFVMKTLMVAFDLATIVLIGLTLRVLNRPIADVVLYAWNPLVVKAVAGSGHVDSLLALFLAATAYFVVKGAHYKAAVTWGLSVLVKISPLVLLPFLILRLGWRRTAIGAAVILIAYAPYLDGRGSAFVGLWTFANQWQFNSGPFALIGWLVRPFTSEPILAAKLATGLMFLGVIIWTLHQDDGTPGSFAFCSVTALGGLLILSPTVMPWYLVWIIPLAVVARSFAWIQFSPLVCLAFLFMIDGRERPWVLCIEYGIMIVLLWRGYSSFRYCTEARAHSDAADLAQRCAPTAYRTNSK